MQGEVTMTYHFILSRLTKIRTLDNAKCWQDYGDAGTLTYY